MRHLTFGACLYPSDPLPDVVRIARPAEELGYDSPRLADSQILPRERIAKQTSRLTSRVKPDLFEGDEELVKRLALPGTSKDLRGGAGGMATVSGFGATVLNAQPGGRRFTTVEKSLETFAEGVVGRMG